MSIAIEIKNRYTGAVLYTHKTTEKRQASGFAIRDALEAACKADADLIGADLTGTNLYGVKLTYADLCGALLTGTNLYGVNLTGTNLYGVNLTDAKVRSHQLVGERPYLQIGPIGSRCAQMTLWITKDGPYIQTGCFFGTRAQFESAVNAEHGANKHGKEYTAALALIDAHTSLWTPAEVQAEKGAA